MIKNYLLKLTIAFTCLFQASLFAQNITVSTFSGTGYGSLDGPSNIGIPVPTFRSPVGLAVDGSGNIYVADEVNQKIRKITPAGVVSTFAGSGASGSADGIGTAATFFNPQSVAVDASGNVYVADGSNRKIRKITSAGVVSTLAGSGVSGSANGTGAAASFTFPMGVAVDASGNVYVADHNANRIRKITPAGVVSTFAGSGVQGSADGTGTAASFNSPAGIALDGSGNVYIADYNNHKIRKITPSGVVSTFAGNGTMSNAEGTGTAAGFSFPAGVAVDGSGNIYVADHNNHKIRKITPARVVSTLTGNGTQGTTDGNKTIATFSYPDHLAADAAGNVYVANLNKIRKVTPAGVVSTVAGTGAPGDVDGTGIAASFIHVRGVAIDASGNLYVADSGNNKIRKITPAGLVSTLAGSGLEGSIDGTGSAANFYAPSGVAVDGAGNVYVADRLNHKIRKITPGGVVSTFAGSGVQGSADGTGTAASFAGPWGIAVDASGNVYIADSGSNKIRKITPAGVVTTFAGSGTAGNTDGTGMTARFNFPVGVTVDASGTVYVAGGSGNNIRKITPGGVVSTLVDAAAGLNFPAGVAVDGTGNVYVTDYYNQKIRKITSTGVVSTLAGTGTYGSIDGDGTIARFYNPVGVVVDNSGNLYVGDDNNNKVRKITIDLTTTSLTDNTSHVAALRNAEVFPNPSDQIVYLFAEDAAAEVKVSIFSGTGQLVYENGRVPANTNVELPSLGTGVYILKVYGSAGEITKKLVRY